MAFNIAFYSLTQAQSSSVWSSLIMPVAILGVLVIALFKLAKTLRKWAIGGGDSDANLGNFSIDQLRKMRSQGKLTETEYEHAKAAVIEQSRHMLDD